MTELNTKLERAARLAEIVAACRDSYGDKNYPYDEEERLQAGYVQIALRELGHEVSLSDAAGVWEAYSLSLQAGWMAGAESVKSAKECLEIFCLDVD